VVVVCVVVALKEPARANGRTSGGGGGSSSDRWVVHARGGAHVCTALGTVVVRGSGVCWGKETRGSRCVDPLVKV
jgi:hypothetical protein